MKSNTIRIALLAVVLVVAAFLLVPKVRSLWPAFGPRPPLPAESVGQSPGSGTATQGPLRAAPGWTVSLLTDKVPGARDLVRDQFGNVWVSQTSQGTVSTVYLKDAKPGVQPEVVTVLKGLRKPHGLVFDPENLSTLYIAQETSISRLPTYSDGPLVKVANLPSGGGHFTRSLAFGSDGRLYISIGSTCNVCHETNNEIATIISIKPDGSDRRTVATGLRNAVFLAFRPGSNDLWTTEMGRDSLGDNLPPDEIDIVRAGSNYGWPICYGNRIHDTKFDTNQYIRDPCEDSVPPHIALPAHVAPLGLAFMPDGDLLVSYHGSWNSSVPVGYKVVRWNLSNNGSKVGQVEDFLTGFLKGSSASGRPVDVLPMPDGSVLVSDDKSGSIWKVTPDRR